MIEPGAAALEPQPRDGVRGSRADRQIEECEAEVVLGQRLQGFLDRSGPEAVVSAAAEERGEAFAQLGVGLDDEHCRLVHQSTLLFRSAAGMRSKPRARMETLHVYRVIYCKYLKVQCH